MKNGQSCLKQLLSEKLNFKILKNIEIKLKWKYEEGNFDTKTLKLIDIPARGIRGEYDAEIAIEDGMNMTFADVHLGDVDSSNAFAKEIVRRWNEFPEELKK